MMGVNITKRGASGETVLLAGSINTSPIDNFILMRKRTMLMLSGV